MGLQDVPEIKIEYKTLQDEVVRDFYLPCLKEACEYKRAVGFFSSTILLQISQGLSAIASKHGRIKLLISPRLDTEDYKAIENGYKIREYVCDKMIRDFDEDVEFYQKEDRFAMLAKLIAENILDIKVVCLEKDNDLGMYHEKIGIFKDENETMVAFSGSANETYNGFNRNFESIDVYCSWNSLESNNRCISKDMHFNQLWAGGYNHLITIPFPEVIKNKILKYKKDDLNILELDDKLAKELDREQKRKSREPSTENIQLYDYQKSAIKEWIENNAHGIFDMATGTGKTFTGAGAIAELYKRKRRLAVIICCPYIHLVDQWAEEVRLFNIHPIVCYSGSKYEKSLNRQIQKFEVNISDFICIIVSNGTFKTEKFQRVIAPIIHEALLVVDEAHNFGAQKISEYMNPTYPYRLALSATLDRYGDLEGTKKLYNFFGEKCIEYTLEQAILEQKLTPYKYYPVPVYLNEDELSEYQDLTRKIRRILSWYNDKNMRKIPEQAKRLLIKRARLIAGASSKISRLKEILKEKYTKSSNLLIYCGAVKYDEDESSVNMQEEKQINVVTRMLNAELNISAAKFTAEESVEERRAIINAFKQRDLQALVAIKCLDEGMNIPAIETAFILASSINPKEYIQRRGRVLRKYPGKEYAIIYDFVTLPRNLDMADFLSSEDRKTDLSLVKRELVRIDDFANLALNTSDSNELIYKIKNAYGMDRIKIEEINEYE